MNFQTFGGYQEDLWPQAFADTDVELAPASATPNPAKVGSASVRIEGVVKQHGATRVLHGIDLQIAPGEFFVLLGPSGSGKTTTLRILAGLESVSAGHVYMDGADVTTKEPGLRDVAMVFQSYALYPHMTVEQNIGFPLKMVGTGKEVIGRSVDRAAAMVGIAHLLQRTPGQLSGGQQQRVALARAIVRQPRLFLLDEPLSNLDAKLRLETRVELKRLQRSLGVTTVYVTHDQEEAMTLADRIAVFMDGRIVQVGSPRQIFAKPLSIDVASFIGSPPMNLLVGEWEGHAVTVGGSTVAVAIESPQSRDVVIGVRPSDLRLADGGLRARVEGVEHLGDNVVVDLVVDERLVKLKTDRAPVLREGEAVFVAFAPEDAHLFDAESGARIA
jgi:multiple sugar transport system ATP-binding protein